MTVQTDDGKQKTTKLERIGMRATFRKDTVFNNIGHVIDFDFLRECYRQQNGNKAVGIDGVTKDSYEIKLEDNLQDLLARIRRNAYKPQASRLVEIPKEDGSTRPLAIACLEDKIVQRAVTKILTAVFEPQFLACSYGYREGKNGHEALRALMKYSNQNTDGVTIEIDLRKYFNTIPHDTLQGILREKISDRRFLETGRETDSRSNYGEQKSGTQQNRVPAGVDHLANFIEYLFALCDGQLVSRNRPKPLKRQSGNGKIRG